ncbi:MAG TPA: hypothetical protein VIQ30_25230 [Pseudonocardia sp.]
MTASRRRVYVDATMASVHLLWTFDALIPASTIRTWGERGHVTRLPRGKCRYDLDDVIEHARRMGLLGDR